MRCLLDTHTFLWMIANHPQLSNTVKQILVDPSHDLYFSSVSAWEIAIKYRLGKLQLAQPPGQFIPDQVQLNRLTVLPVQMEHGLQVALLPDLHNDPFDRLLIAQAMLENLVLLSIDPVLKGYPVTILW